MPSNAYFISGHGGQNLDYEFIVPENCIIVAKAHAGEVVEGEDLNKNFQKLCHLPYDILTKPLNNIPILVKLFGSLAIYKPGDICPLFTYQLINCYRTKNGDFFACNNIPSGIIDLKTIDENKCAQYSTFHPMMEISDLKTDNDLKFFLTKKLFQNSIYPRKKDVSSHLITSKEYFDKFQQGSIATKFKIISDYSDLTNIIETNQEELCNKFPGVYYNFICRYKPNKLYEFKSPINYNIPPSIFNVPESNRALLFEKIAEAEISRKPFIKKYYNLKAAQNFMKTQKASRHLIDKNNNSNIEILNIPISNNSNFHMKNVSEKHKLFSNTFNNNNSRISFAPLQTRRNMPKIPRGGRSRKHRS